MKRMKLIKAVCTALAVFCATGISGCGKDTTGATPVGASEAVDATAAPVESQGSGILDLTVLSSTMIYSEVYAMVSDPGSYEGREVRMKGKFAAYYDEYSGNNYFACVISDATACCSQGLEFQLAGEAEYPKDYPEAGAEITVKGTFGTYSENYPDGTSQKYCTLYNSVFE